MLEHLKQITYTYMVIWLHLTEVIPEFYTENYKNFSERNEYLDK